MCFLLIDGVFFLCVDTLKRRFGETAQREILLFFIFRSSNTMSGNQFGEIINLNVGGTRY